MSMHHQLTLHRLQRITQSSNAHAIDCMEGCLPAIHSYIFNAERCFLVWWPEDCKVSVLLERDILVGAAATVGKSCVVSYGKATYVHTYVHTYVCTYV